MKLRNKLLLSALIGFCAMLLSTTPMWWGVLFSPISQQLTSAPVTEAYAGRRTARSSASSPLICFFLSSINHSGKRPIRRKSEWAVSESSLGAGAGAGPAAPARERGGRKAYLRRFLLPEKYSFVSLKTTGHSTIMPIRLGMAIRPLRVSAMSQARPSSMVALMMITRV